MRILFGTTTVTTAGTAVQISNTANKLVSLKVQARNANTGRMFIGLSDVTATVNGWELPIPLTTRGKEVLDLDFHDGSVLLSLFYVNSTVNGEIVDWVAILN